MKDPRVSPTQALLDGSNPLPPVQPPPELDARIRALLVAGAARSRTATWLARVETFALSTLGVGYAVCMVGYLAGRMLGY
jgi:hypothetical protein